MTGLWRLWPAAAVLILLGGTWLHGRHYGSAWCEAAHVAALAEAQRETFEAAETASRAEQERLAAQAERDALAQQLEDAAYADAMAHPACLSADRVRRLNAR